MENQLTMNSLNNALPSNCQWNKSHFFNQTSVTPREPTSPKSLLSSNFSDLASASCPQALLASVNKTLQLNKMMISKSHPLLPKENQNQNQNRNPQQMLTIDQLLHNLNTIPAPAAPAAPAATGDIKVSPPDYVVPLQNQPFSNGLWLSGAYIDEIVADSSANRVSGVLFTNPVFANSFCKHVNCRSFSSFCRRTMLQMMEQDCLSPIFPVLVGGHSWLYRRFIQDGEKSYWMLMVFSNPQLSTSLMEANNAALLQFVVQSFVAERSSNRLLPAKLKNLRLFLGVLFHVNNFIHHGFVEQHAMVSRFISEANATIQNYENRFSQSDLYRFSLPKSCRSLNGNSVPPQKVNQENLRKTSCIQNVRNCRDDLIELRNLFIQNVPSSVQGNWQIEFERLIRHFDNVFRKSNF